MMRSAPFSSAWNAEDLEELNPLEAALDAEDGHPGEPVPVRLHSRVTEVATLELIVPQHARPQALENLLTDEREAFAARSDRDHPAPWQGDA